MRRYLRLGINPIIVKELRSRMRGGRAFATLTGVLLVLGGVSYLIYRMALAAPTYSPAPLSPQIGQTMFLALAFLELVMVCAIAPAVTAGAISGEQEKLTYEMLLATPLPPASILWGKLVSALSYVFLLVFAAVPMASLIFIFGGVAPRDMLKALVILLAVAVTFGILGLFLSALLRRTSRATVVSFLVVAALMFGTIFLYVAVGVISRAEPPRWLLVPNPISALFSALAPSTPYETYPMSIIGYLGMGLAGNFQMISGQTISQTSIPRPLYHYSLPVFGGLSLLLYLLSTRLVLPARRWRLRRKEALVAAALLLAFGGTIALAFLSTAERYPRLEQPASQGAPNRFPGRVMVESRVQVPAIAVAPAQPADQAAPLPPSEEDQAAIYAAALRQLYAVDYFADQPPDSALLYLVEWSDAGLGEADPAQGESLHIPEAVRQGLVEAASLPAEVQWIENSDQAMRGETVAFDSRLYEFGLIVVFGNIQPQPDGGARVAARLYGPRLDSLEKTYLLMPAEGGWQIAGEAGEE